MMMMMILFKKMYSVRSAAHIGSSYQSIVFDMVCLLQVLVMATQFLSGEIGFSRLLLMLSVWKIGVLA